MNSEATHTPGTDYGVDAPAVMRNLFIIGVVCILLGLLLPPVLRLGTLVTHTQFFFWMGGCFLVEGLLFLLYVKYGKFRHRDMMLSLHTWRGDEQVLDVGCGRGLLLAGAAKRLTTGHATGIDIWSNVDMGGNSDVATLRNLELEGVLDRCTLVSMPVQRLTEIETFNVILSNLCLHNIRSAHERLKAVERIAYALKPGGTAYISDYKNTREYAKHFRGFGLEVTKKHGSFLTTFPPLTVVIARKT